MSVWIIVIVVQFCGQNVACNAIMDFVIVALEQVVIIVVLQPQQQLQPPLALLAQPPPHLQPQQPQPLQYQHAVIQAAMDTFLTVAQDVNVVQPHAIMVGAVLLGMHVSQHRNQTANHIVLALPQQQLQPPLALLPPQPLLPQPQLYHQINGVAWIVPQI